MKTRVLVVDDEPDYRVIVQDMLTSAGINSAAAADGSQALTTIEGFKPDVILLDWAMPKLDGEGLCRALRADPRHKGIPIIMMTVKREIEAEIEALHFGVDGYLTKPFKGQELVSRIHSVLRTAQKQG